MKGKKLGMMLGSLALVAVVGVGATLAYFTDQEQKVNVVTMGHVDIDLTETGEGELTDGGMEFDGIVPGDKISKKPVISVTEQSQAAYLRVLLTTDYSQEFQQAGIDQDEILSWLNMNADAWVKGEEDQYGNAYYYYQHVADPGTALTLFDLVQIPTTLGNEIADANFSIIIKAEAIQADHFAPTRNVDNQIISWGTVTTESYN